MFRPTHSTSFLPFDLPTGISEAFDLPNRTLPNPSYNRRNSNKMEILNKESFTPFGNRVSRGFGISFGFMRFKKDKERMELPIQDRPTRTPGISGRTVTPMDSITSLSGYGYGYSRTPTPTPMESITSLSSTYSTSHPPPEVQSNIQDKEDRQPTPSIYSQPEVRSNHHPYAPRPTLTRTFTQTPDELAIAALEQLSYHFLAENKIPGYRHRSYENDREKEGGYERTRATPRTRKDSVNLSESGGLRRDRSPLRGDAIRKEGQVKGWRRLRPSSSGGKSYKSTLSPPPIPNSNHTSTEVIDVRREEDQGSKGQGKLSRMRSISSTRLNTGIGLGIEFNPPRPPKAPSRPKYIHKSSNYSNVSGVEVALLLSPIDGDTRGIKGEIPRGVMRDSMNSRTGTEVTLLSPRRTPIQLTPLPSLPPFSLETFSRPFSPTSQVLSTQPSFSSLKPDPPPSRFSKLHNKPPKSSPAPASSERLSGESTQTREGSSNGHGDKIVEEGLRVLEEFTKREKLIPRDEPRLRSSISLGNGKSEHGRNRRDKELEDREWEKREGLTALSFLSLNSEERQRQPKRELSISIPNPNPSPLKPLSQRRGDHEKRLSILHIIPPEERNRIGPTTPIPITSPSTITTTSHRSTTPRHKTPTTTTTAPIYPIYSSIATSPISPPTALLPPPRSRKMTSRGGSVPISPQPRSLGLGLGLKVGRGDEGRCLSMGALGGNSSYFDTGIEENVEALLSTPTSSFTSHLTPLLEGDNQFPTPLTDKSDNYHITGTIPNVGSYTQIHEVLDSEVLTGEDGDGDGVEPLFTPSKPGPKKKNLVDKKDDEVESMKDNLDDLGLGEFGASSGNSDDSGVSGEWR